MLCSSVTDKWDPFGDMSPHRFNLLFLCALPVLLTQVLSLELLLQSQVFFFLFLQLDVWASLCGMTYVQRLSHERKKQSSGVELYIFSELAKKTWF